MKRLTQLLCLALLLLLTTDTGGLRAQRTDARPFVVMSYNVENLFDTTDDPHTNDNEFLPRGARRWTSDRYHAHLRQTALVIRSVGGREAPALVGLCEVENEAVLRQLLREKALRSLDYRYCITRGNDPRGINNALLYRHDRFRLIGWHTVRIPFTEHTKRSRDLLYVCGHTDAGDTLDIIVCHFPSRRGGQKATERARMDAARCVRRLSDSISRQRRRPHLIVMGDFNDTPTDRSIRLMTATREHRLPLINLFADPRRTGFPGSHYYRGKWTQLDQMLVSPLLADRLTEARVFAPDYLLTEDGRRRNRRPLRIYNGQRYEGGFSDHLPIVATFEGR